jgi:CBS domain containing-hemolysin-like protein
MLLLITYVLIALGFSFLCSIAEAVILSVTSAHVALMEQDGHPAGPLLRKLKHNINEPLAAILTLNTIAHTVGAAGAGAQATATFGSHYLGIVSAILTLLILIFSEIIPKTLGAHHWKSLAPATAYGLKFLILALYPFVRLSEKLTRGLTEGPSLKGFNRSEFSAMADLSAEEGLLAREESEILKNLLLLQKTSVEDVMTPRTVVFSLPQNLKIESYIADHDDSRFSRIPIYAENIEDITGFVLKDELLLAQARGQGDHLLEEFSREIVALLESESLARALDEMLRQRSQIALAVDEYGGMQGLVTLEDLLETLLGLEIVDESDDTVDMRKLARRLWKQRAAKMGLDIDELEGDGE